MTFWILLLLQVGYNISPLLIFSYNFLFSQSGKISLSTNNRRRIYISAFVFDAIVQVSGMENLPAKLKGEKNLT